MNNTNMNATFKKTKKQNLKKIQKNRISKNQDSNIYSTPQFRKGKMMYSAFDDYDAYYRQFMDKHEFFKTLQNEYDSLYADYDEDMIDMAYFEEEKKNRLSYDTDILYNSLIPPYKRHNSIESIDNYSD